MQNTILIKMLLAATTKHELLSATMGTSLQKVAESFAKPESKIPLKKARERLINRVKGEHGYRYVLEAQVVGLTNMVHELNEKVEYLIGREGMAKNTVGKEPAPAIDGGGDDGVLLPDLPQSPVPKVEEAVKPPEAIERAKDTLVESPKSAPPKKRSNSRKGKPASKKN